MRLLRKPPTPMRGMLATPALFGAIFASVLVASAAAVTYSPPKILDEGGADVTNPQVAVDPSGRATVVWERADSRGSSTSLIQSVRLGEDGARVGPVRTLSESGASEPRVAVDPFGVSVVAWVRFDQGDKPSVQAVRLGSDGAPLGPVQTLSPKAREAAQPQVAADATGRATVVWADDQVFFVRLGPDGAPESEPKPVSELGRARSPRLAVEPSGRATVAWKSRETIRAARLGVDDVPEGAVLKLSPAGTRNVRDPQVAVDEQGRATVVWEGSGKRSRGIHAVRLGEDGAPGKAQLVSQPVLGSRFPQVAVAQSGRTVVVWQGWRPPRGLHGFPQGRTIYAAPLRASGKPGSVRGVSKKVAAFANPRVAIDPQGRATVVWPRSDGVSTRIQAVRLRPNGVPGEVRTLSAPGRKGLANAGDPAVAADRRGATVAWVRLEGKFFRIEATRSTG